MIISPEIEVIPSFSDDFMKPNPTVVDQGDLFRSRLDQIFNRLHPLYHLADTIEWPAFDKDFGKLYVENVDRPGLPVRLLVGLHYLKHAFNESDESIVERHLVNFRPITMISLPFVAIAAGTAPTQALFPW
jgi:hypothetical protein